MKILMVSSEVFPYAKTGGLADVVGALPLALKKLGADVSIILPLHQGIEGKFSLEKTGIKVQAPIAVEDSIVMKDGEVLSLEDANGVKVYFLKNDEYYDRDYLYASPSGDYIDNAPRFTFFSRATLEFLRQTEDLPDVIHCHDWQSALIPVYLKTLYSNDGRLRDIKTLLTIHNLGYQGIFWKWDMKLIGLDWSYFAPEFLEYHGKVNFLKGGIVFSDLLTTVSRKYSEEIQTEDYGHGLDGILRSRQESLFGILNGIDYSVWNPETDKKIPANYSKDDLSGKLKCKQELQEAFGLPVNNSVPVIGVVSRLADQKGFDIVAQTIEDIMSHDLQFVLLGTGEKKYHEMFESIKSRYPDKAGIRISYEDNLAHLIEAGADIFLMPSRYEPCGLNQMISLKYGTVPLVRATGGLDDTIDNYNPETRSGNGFKFNEYTAAALIDKLLEALDIYGSPEQWPRLVENGMSEDHSWGSSAEKYLALYDKLVRGRIK
jgi:starch synthase